MSKATIWNRFKAYGFSDEFIAGLMGNFECESNCEACRLQGDFSADRSLSKAYARQVNDGTIPASRYITDQKGWGLAQWTFSTRKQALLEFCWNRGCGIEDESAQVDFVVEELKTDFPAIYGMRNCTDIQQVSDSVCLVYENPAVKNYGPRYAEAQKIYAEFHGKTVSDEDWIQDGIEYWESVKAEIQAKIDDLRRRL